MHLCGIYVCTCIKVWQEICKYLSQSVLSVYLAYLSFTYHLCIFF